MGLVVRKMSQTVESTASSISHSAIVGQAVGLLKPVWQQMLAWLHRMPLPNGQQPGINEALAILAGGVIVWIAVGLLGKFISLAGRLAVLAGAGWIVWKFVLH